MYFPDNVSYIERTGYTAQKFSYLSSAVLVLFQTDNKVTKLDDNQVTKVDKTKHATFTDSYILLCTFASSTF